MYKITNIIAENICLHLFEIWWSLNLKEFENLKKYWESKYRYFKGIAKNKLFCKTRFSTIFLKIQNHVCQSPGVKDLKKLLPKDFCPSQNKQTKKETIGLVIDTVFDMRDIYKRERENEQWKSVEILKFMK